mgnify:CR=1 FL=1
MRVISSHGSAVSSENAPGERGPGNGPEHTTMTDDNSNEPGVNDETVIRNPNEDEDGESNGRNQPTTGQNQPTTGQDGSSGRNQPSTGGNQPSTGGNQPSTGQNQPTAGGNQPSTGQNQPSTGGNQPSTGQNQPTTGGSQPSTGGSQPSTGASTQATGTGTSSSSGTGLDSNLAGALAYLFAPLGGIAMYVLEDDDFVQFHAVQGIAFGVLMFLVWVGATVVWFLGGMVLGDVPVLGLLWGLVSLLMYPVIGFIGFALWAFLTYKAYKGERYGLPVIGGFAE